MNLTCYDYLKARAQKMGDFDAAVAFGSGVKLSRIIGDADALAAYINLIGVKAGEVVAVFLPNLVHSFAVFYGLNKIGVVANIVHPLTPPEELKEIIGTTKSKAIFVLDIMAEKYVGVINDGGIPCIVCSASDYAPVRLAWAVRAFEKLKSGGLGGLKSSVKYSEALQTGAKNKSPYSRDGSKTAVYLHGGGTTGKSKTIMLSSNNLNNLAEKLSALDSPHKPGDEYSLMILPIFHAFGLAVAAHFAVTHGFVSIPTPKFDAKKANADIKKYNVTFILGVPNMFKKMFEEKNFAGPHLRKLRLVFCGGDYLSERFVKDFNRAIAENGGKGKLFRGYGLTEVSSVCAVNTYENSRESSVGKPLGDAVVEIWDDMKRRLPAGRTGEIVVRNDSVMQGYFRGDASVLNDGVYVDKNGGRWILTGDLGRVDGDGYVYFTGRKKRMIVISGYNVYPIDIENVALRLPFVNEACAVQGYLKNKPCVKLCVSLKSRMDREEAEDKILACCKKNLAKFSCPRKIEIYESLPKTKMAKIDFMKLSDKYDPKEK